MSLGTPWVVGSGFHQTPVQELLVPSDNAEVTWYIEVTLVSGVVRQAAWEQWEVNVDEV